MPLAQMEDVPSVLSSVTSALRPNDPQEIYVPWQPKKKMRGWCCCLANCWGFARCKVVWLQWSKGKSSLRQLFVCFEMILLQFVVDFTWGLVLFREMPKLEYPVIVHVGNAVWKQTRASVGCKSHESVHCRCCISFMCAYCLLPLSSFIISFTDSV